MTSCDKCGADLPPNHPNRKMKAILKGHSYVLKNLDGGTQALAFIKKQPVPNGKKGEMEVVQNGTTNEEVIAMLVDRMKFLNDSMPSRENVHVITLLEKAQMWLGKRTADRKKRKVEGTHLA